MSKVLNRPVFLTCILTGIFCTGPNKANTGENRLRSGDLLSSVFALYFSSGAGRRRAGEAGREVWKTTATASTQPLSPLEGRRWLGVLLYTPEEAAVPDDALNMTSLQ